MTLDATSPACERCACPAARHLTPGTECSACSCAAYHAPPALDDGDVRIYQGDAQQTLQRLPTASVQSIVTSPPFWGLRDYGEPGQIGAEPTPEEWVERLVAVFRAARRVLHPTGTLWLEVGDSYASNAATAQAGGFNSTRGSATPTLNHPHQGRNAYRGNGIKAKDLVGAPWMLAFALRADGWYLRAENIWHKPNPMPESVSDRTTRAHSQVFLLSAAPQYFYDADAIREPVDEASLARYERGSRYDDVAEVAAVPYAATRPRGSKRRTVREGVDVNGGGQGSGEMGWDLAVGANARSVWRIPTEPTTFAHFATMPTALAAKCILAGTRPGDVVLDPFMGSGTTALTARSLGRRALGVELSSEYLAIASERLQQLALPL